MEANITLKAELVTGIMLNYVSQSMAVDVIAPQSIEEFLRSIPLVRTAIRRAEEAPDTAPLPPGYDNDDATEPAYYDWNGLYKAYMYSSDATFRALIDELAEAKIPQAVLIVHAYRFLEGIQ